MIKLNLNHRRMKIRIYDDGYLRVEHDNYLVFCQGQRINIPRAQFLMFSCLVERAERVVSAPELWHYAWGEQKPFRAVSLQVALYHIRRIFKPFGIEIETWVNVGYRFVPRQTASNQMPEKKAVVFKV